MILSILIFGWILLLVYESGRTLLPRCLRDSTVVSTWLALTLGLGVWSMGIFVLGVPHVFELRTVLAIMLGLTVLFTVRRVVYHRSVKRVTGQRPPEQPQDSSPALTAILGLLVAVPCFLALGGALTPEIRGDSIIYHISASRLFVLNRGHIEIPSSALTYIPQHQQLLYALGLLVGNDSTSKLFHWVAGVLVLIGTYCVTIALGVKRPGGLAAAALIALHPTWIYLATATMVDLGVCNYILAAVYLLWMEPDDSRTRLPRAVLAGVFLGFAMGGKYTAGIVGTLPVLLIEGWRAFRSRERVWQCLVIALTSFAVFSPWLVRNWLWTGNPIAPAFMGLLGPAGVPESTLSRPDIQAGNPAIWRSPFLFLREYWTVIGGMQVFGYNLPLVFACLALIVLVFRAEIKPFPQAARLLLAFLLISVAIGVPLGAVRSEPRYVMSHFGVAAALCVFWVMQWMRVKTQPARLLSSVGLTYLMVVWLQTIPIRTAELKETFMPLLSATARREFLRERLKNYDAMLALSHAGLNPAHKVLGAAYPAPVHYVLWAGALHPALENANVSQVRKEDLPGLRSEGVLYLFGEVNESVRDHVDPVGKYDGIPLYQIK